MFIGRGIIGQAAGGPAGAWDITNAAYNTKSLYIGTQEAKSEGVWMGDNDTKVFLLGETSDTVYRYDLSTAGDITTSTLNANSLYVGTWATKPTDLSFKPDGTRLFVCDYGGSKVFSFTLSTAWDLSTASYDTKVLFVATTLPQGMFMDDTGTYLFTQEHFNNDFIRYSMSTPWDLTTATIDVGQTFRAGTGLIMVDMFLRDDGTRLFGLGLTPRRVYQWDLSTAWDLTTTGSLVTYDTIGGETDVRGMCFNSDGSAMYVCGWTLDRIHQYDISV